MRVGVIGVGHLGKHHARILAGMAHVELTAVVDSDRARGEAVAAQCATQWCSEPRELRGRVDAVTIATPTSTHATIAAGFLEQGTHVLVEKPMTTTSAEADALMALAEARGLTLAVGHTERFNPAVAAIKPLVNGPRFIEVHRLGTFPDRSLDVDVVFDLMIHDLDIVLDIVGGEVVSVEAVGVPVLTPRVDIANVRLRFDHGCIVNLTASRISRERVRKIRFFQRDAYVSVDYAAQEAEVYRLVGQAGQSAAIEGGRLRVTNEEPLKRELEDFVDAIRQHRPPVVTAEQGCKALRLAERVIAQMEMVK